MADEPKRIIVDDDWKAEARREKERLSEKATQPEELPPASLAEILNLVAMQALAGLGMLVGPQGERIPPDLPLARHYIDLIALLEEKTRGNLTPDEQKLIEAVLYDLRMRYVHVTSGGGAPGAAAPAPDPGPKLGST